MLRVAGCGLRVQPPTPYRGLSHPATMSIILYYPKSPLGDLGVKLKTPLPFHLSTPSLLKGYLSVQMILQLHNPSLPWGI
jgi:hypothetical protein